MYFLRALGLSSLTINGSGKLLFNRTSQIIVRRVFEAGIDGKDQWWGKFLSIFHSRSHPQCSPSSDVRSHPQWSSSKWKSTPPERLSLFPSIIQQKDDWAYDQSCCACSFCLPKCKPGYCRTSSITLETHEVVVITNKNGCGHVYDNANHLQDVYRDQLSWLVVWQYSPMQDLLWIDQVSPKIQVNTPTSTASLARVGCLLPFVVGAVRCDAVASTRSPCR